jgi:hypothetical protein
MEATRRREVSGPNIVPPPARPSLLRGGGCDPGGRPCCAGWRYVLEEGDEVLVVAQTAAEHETHDAFQ